MPDLSMIAAAIFIPPLAVYFHKKECNTDVLINFLLTLTGFYVAGIIDALWMITH